MGTIQGSAGNSRETGARDDDTVHLAVTGQEMSGGHDHGGSGRLRSSLDDAGLHDLVGDLDRLLLSAS
jgi:hypothetical protein